MLAWHPTSAPPVSASVHRRSASSNINSPFASPNAIPPRTSSTGLYSTHKCCCSHPVPLPSALHPLAEGSWLGSNKQKKDTADMAMQQDKKNGPSENDGSAPPQHRPLFSPERYAHDDLNFTPSRSWNEFKEGIVRAPYEYVTRNPGKSFRSQLIAGFNGWLQVPQASLEIITKVVGMLHESSLLIDDVQDSSELRRGGPVAHSIFGVAQTINSANYICYVALQEIQKLDSPKAIAVFADELVNLYRGQGMELHWRETLTCPSEDDYLEMVGNKTAGLFRLGVKLMQAASESDIDCVPLVNLIGLIYQIRDDYLNLWSRDYTHNKGMCEDLTEGKFSFPVIHSICANPSNLELINILKQKTKDVQVKHYAVSYMESTGSFAYTRAVVSTLVERARRTALDLDAGQGKVDQVMKILDKMVLEAPRSSNV